MEVEVTSKVRRKSGRAGDQISRTSSRRSSLWGTEVLLKGGEPVGGSLQRSVLQLEGIWRQMIHFLDDF